LPSPGTRDTAPTQGSARLGAPAEVRHEGLARRPVVGPGERPLPDDALPLGGHLLQHLPRVAGSATGANLKVIARAFRDLARFRLRLSRELRGGPGEQNAFLPEEAG